MAAPEVRVLPAARVSASGGAGGPSPYPGGAGGLGRIRVSALPELCTLTGTLDPAPVSGCTPTPGAGTSGRIYVGVYPD